MKNVGPRIPQADQDKKNVIASTLLQSKFGSSITCRHPTEEPLQICHSQGMIFRSGSWDLSIPKYSKVRKHHLKPREHASNQPTPILHEYAPPEIWI